MKKTHPKKISYIISKIFFLIFQEIEFFSPKNKKLQEGNFWSRNIKKKKHLEKNLLYFEKWNFLAPTLRSSYILWKRFPLFFGKWNVLGPSPKKTKKILYFSKESSLHISGWLLIKLWNKESLIFQEDCQLNVNM